jgi:PKD repeat protein
MPVVDISADIISGKTPLNVSFSSEVNDPDGTIVNWTWNFGDGSKAYSQNPSHIFTVSGSFTVNLTVIDDNGAKVTDSIIISVSENQPPEISESNTYANEFVNDPMSFSFHCSADDPDGNIVSYYWTFGDGQTSTEQNPYHTYSNEGIYEAKITVTDDDGAIDSLTITVEPHQSEIEPTDAAYVYSYLPSNNFESLDLCVGFENYGTTHERITYLKFDLPDIPEATIESAKLSLYCYSTHFPLNVQVHRSTDVSWEEETITWNNKPSYSSDSSDTVEVNNDTWCEWDVTNYVQDALSSGQLTIVLDAVISENHDYTYAFFYESHQNKGLSIET